MKNFKDISYFLHSQQYALDKDNELSSSQMSWLRRDTVDYWRHHRMTEPVMPFAQHSPGSSWITFGDGRLGLDAQRLKGFESSINVLPTDISTLLLEKAKQLGLIENYSYENAENLSVEDDSYDYCFCKESFHHFPRPYIALYEMIRVARKAVILIEPADDYKKPIPFLVLEGVKLWIKKNIGMPIKHPDFYRFETSGNYVYTISHRDIEKVAAGLQLPMIGIKYFNDYYEEGVELSMANKSSKLFNRIKSKIKLLNVMCWFGLTTPTGMVAVIFKEVPSEKLINSLKINGFRLIDIPTNPYLK
jgi:ubiquinone/menaquinone biosynthesis C-methylase UbiE